MADAIAAPPRERPSFSADSPAARAEEMAAPWAEARERRARKASFEYCIFGGVGVWRKRFVCLFGKGLLGRWLWCREVAQ